MSNVKSITLYQLENRMKAMKTGEVIGLAQETWQVTDEPEDGMGWFGIKLIDLSGVDNTSMVWVVQWFGGGDFRTPSILYDNGYDFIDDLVSILKEKELLQPDGTVLIDENDWKEREDMPKYDEPTVDWNDAFEKLRELADKADQLASDIEETKEYHDKWAENHDLAIVAVRELTTIMQKAAEMAEEIDLTMERKEVG